MKKLFTGILLCLCISSVYPQNAIFNSPFPDDDIKRLHGEVVDFGNNEMYALWSKFESTGRIQFFMRKSTDGGNQWQNEETVFDTVINGSMEDAWRGAHLIKGNNNRLLLFIKTGSSRHTIYKYSDDGGVTWTPNIRIIIANGTFTSQAYRIFSVVHLGEGKLILTSSNSTSLTGTVRSSDNGTTWQNLVSTGFSLFMNPSLLSIGNGSFYMAAQQTAATSSKRIFFVKYISTNTWQDTVIVHEDTSASLALPRLFRNSNNDLYIFFSKSVKVFGKYSRTNIFYSKSSNEGATWGTPVQVTKYPGVDANLNLNSQSVKPFITFSSDRNNLQGAKKLFWTNALELQDNSTPPVIYDYEANSASVTAGDTIKIKVFTGSESPVTEAKITGYLNDLPYNLQLFDDGNHNDSLAGDKIFGNFIRVAQEGDLLRYSVSVQNAFGTSTTAQNIIACPFSDLPSSAELKTGRLIVPFDYNGTIADVATASGSGLKFDSVMTIFSQGFLLSGLIESNVWAAGEFSASRIKDFRAGQVGYPANDPRNGIYRVALTDTAFGTSWQRWKGAVSLGAKFWDGNNNNIYDPVDLNQNGNWEPNEDMPEILGEVSYFTVFNDGVPSALRRFLEEPKGIEIRQTLYAFPNSDAPAMRDAVFIRYEMTKKGNVSPAIRDFIFGIQSDPDLGDANDDLVATDTLRNSVVCYNESADPLFGENPPAIYNTMLFGNPVYIPGVSFTDLNNNGTFENGIDIPLDTAVLPMGKPFNNILYPGAINSGMRVSQHYIQSHPTHGDPNTPVDVRNYHIGKNLTGQYLDPCTWTFGDVRGGVNCSLVNPIFVYSGDPVLNKGWINNTGLDQRTTLASYMSPLDEQTTLTYHTAIIVGRGNSPLNSITVTQANVDTIFSRMGARYNFIPVSTKEPGTGIPGVYELNQNYPNPFNPNTIITFSIPENAHISLKVYDNTGALVKTLLNEELSPGKHSVSFDAGKLSSGVYFYRIESEKFTQTRKMLLIK
ncbi:MAG: exo-alpha-sialidase [Ignavibacteria bacterium]|nr:exo-alpha-sialidase [Ignavibacteria bacterium]